MVFPLVFSAILTILGLVVFETISSVDNAVINAEVLSKMSERARRWFLLWGLLAAVFLVRGLLPFVIFWAANPSLGVNDAFTAMFSGDEKVLAAVEQSAPLLLTGGGVFLIFLFLHWLFIEPKHYGLRIEPFFHSQGVWFYASVSIFLCVITWFALQINPLMAFSAVVGSTAFFITHGFKEFAEKKERELIQGSGMSDVSKVMYLEVIDATFSIDGVVGAFAFTLSVPLILIGNGIGAFVVREMTVRNVKNVKKYVYLKNGAMYSILILGAVMLADSFGAHVPEWFSPIATFAILGYFFWRSHEHLKNSNAKQGLNTSSANN